MAAILNRKATLFAAAVAGGIFASSVALKNKVSAESLHSPEHDWSHTRSFFSALDSASIRRGFEVYRQVCSTCHSMEMLRFRHLVGVSHTETQAKALAASYKVTDGPNEQGEMFERPGRLVDGIPAPYPNEEYARFINGGAAPPDLSYIVKARHGHEDYIFSLLTGYRPAPAGVELRQGLHYNPYFEGGAISMAQALMDGVLDYEDGTPATSSQMAKDVSIFLSWAGEPEHDERKKNGVKLLGLLAATIAFTGYYKRFKWSHLKNRKIRFLY